MAAEIVCSKLREFFLREGQKILEDVIEVTAKPRDKTEARIASAASALKLPFGFCLRVHQGRCGMRAFLRLHQHHRAWQAKRERVAAAVDVVDRLENVERLLAELNDRLAALPGDVARVDGASIRADREEPARAQRETPQFGCAARSA